MIELTGLSGTRTLVNPACIARVMEDEEGRARITDVAGFTFVARESFDYVATLYGLRSAPGEIAEAAEDGTDCAS